MDDDIRIEKNANGVETYVFDPYNPLNKVITENEIKNLLSNYGINTPIFNTKLYERAFVNRSYTKRPDLENAQNNITILERPDDCLPLYTKFDRSNQHKLGIINYINIQSSPPHIFKFIVFNFLSTQT